MWGDVTLLPLIFGHRLVRDGISDVNVLRALVEHSEVLTQGHKGRQLVVHLDAKRARGALRHRRNRGGCILVAAPRALNAIPLPLLVGLNVIRLGGVLFVLLALAGRLSGPFPHISGWGDFVTGALANPVAWLALRETRIGDRLLNGTAAHARGGRRRSWNQARYLLIFSRCAAGA